MEIKTFIGHLVICLGLVICTPSAPVLPKVGRDSCSSANKIEEIRSFSRSRLFYDWGRICVLSRLMACRKRPGQAQARGGPLLAASVYDAPPESEPFANGLREHRCRRMCSWADVAWRLPDPSNGCWASMHIVCVGEALARQRIVWRCTRVS